MFLLVSCRHAGVHPDGHQWRLFTNLYKFGRKASPHILHKKNYCDLNLGESLNMVTSLPFSASELNLLKGILNGVTLKTSN